MPLKPLPRPLAGPGGAQALHLHDTGPGLTSGTRRRPHQQRAAVICSASQASYSDGLVRRHPREVGPLSRGVISPGGAQPLSVRLPSGFCFLPHPLPAVPSASPCGGPTPRGGRRAYHVPRTDHGWVRLCLFAGGSTATAGEGETPAPGHVPFWFKPVSIFGLLVLTTFIGSSPELALPSTLAPDRRDAGSRRGSLAGSPATRIG